MGERTIIYYQYIIHVENIELVIIEMIIILIFILFECYWPITVNCIFVLWSAILIITDTIVIMLYIYLAYVEK